MWIKSYQWDDPFEDADIARWKKLAEDLAHPISLVPRCHIPSSDSPVDYEFASLEMPRNVSTLLVFTFVAAVIRLGPSAFLWLSPCLDPVIRSPCHGWNYLPPSSVCD
uniref:PHM7_ext domain-containing protein n=1 Tax=Haemonchus contortus TaxID=6289 RepID=A0A7I5E4Y8_HAECO